MGEDRSLPWSACIRWGICWFLSPSPLSPPVKGGEEENKILGSHKGIYVYFFKKEPDSPALKVFQSFYEPGG